MYLSNLEHSVEEMMAKRILMVEDSPSVRQLMSFTLRGAGYEVVEANNGEEALQKFASEKVDMVVTDLNMPKMDGKTLIRSLRSDPQNRFLPIVMLTTEDDEDKRRDVRAAGASAWISKPFKPTQLLNVVRMVLA